MAVLFAGVAAGYAFYVVFSRSMSPDEGYLMITVQSFIEGNALYDTVFTHYGPCYYFYEWVVHGLLSVPLTHDATRILCLCHWLIAAILLGLAGSIMMRSKLGGLFVFLQAVIHLKSLANEPGHPQEIIVLVLALGVLAASQGPRKVVFSALAIITALLCFTKINVGVFFGMAVMLTALCYSPNRWAGGAGRWVLTVCCALLPLLLMRPHLAASWCCNYSLIAAGAIFATLLVASKYHSGYSAAPPLGREGEGRGPRAFSLRDFRRMTVFFGAASFIILAITLLTGTSVKGVITGLLLTPLRMPGVALLPLPLANAVLWNGMVALAVGITLALSARDARLHRIVVILKMIYGVMGSLCLISDATAQLGYLLPWVWLVLIPTGEDSEPRPAETFFRTFLVLAAVWQSLQAYPIAGTQVTTATILLVLTYTLCLRDFLLTAGTRLKRFVPSSGEKQMTSRSLVLAPVLGMIVVLYLFVNVCCKLADARREYASLPALGLPGSSLVHMDLESTEMYRALTKYLAAECDTFVTYPGINSLYFWTGKRPPTHLNSTGWGPLSHEQQEHILTVLRQSPRPMLVVVAAAAQGWPSYAPPQISPLVRCVLEDCHEVKRIGRFILFMPKLLKTAHASEGPKRAAVLDPDCRPDYLRIDSQPSLKAIWLS